LANEWPAAGDAKRIEASAQTLCCSPLGFRFSGVQRRAMPIKIGDKLREMKYVQAVAPVLLQFSSSAASM